MEKALKRLIDAEKEAKEIIAAGQLRANKISQEAGKEIARIKSEAEQYMATFQAEKEKELTKELNHLHSVSKKKVEKLCNKIEKQLKSRIESTVQFMLKEFVTK